MLPNLDREALVIDNLNNNIIVQKMLTDTCGICPICRDNITIDILKVHCGHAFHKSCMEDWIAHSQSEVCPLCKQSLDPILFHLKRNDLAELTELLASSVPILVIHLAYAMSVSKMDVFRLFMGTGRVEKDVINETLSEAAFIGRNEFILELLEAGADIHYKNGSILLDAVSNSQLETTKLLVEKGADVNSLRGMCLNTAAGLGDYEMVKYLIEADADVHAAYDNALVISVSGGNVEVVKFLLAKGSNVHGQDNSALKIAVEEYSFDIVKVLVEAGANIHVDNEYCLFEAVTIGSLEITKLLVEKGADVKIDYEKKRGNTTDRFSLMALAAASGNFDLVKYLHKVGVPIEESREHKTALIFSSENGYLEICQYLMENGANVHQLNDALSKAAVGGHFEVAKCLIQAGARTNGKFLINAVSTGNLDLVQLLVEHGSPFNADNDYPSLIAAIEGFKEIEDFLVSKGAKKYDLNSVNLSQECANFRVESVRYILRRGKRTGQEVMEGLLVAVKVFYCRPSIIVEFLGLDGMPQRALLMSLAVSATSVTEYIVSKYYGALDINEAFIGAVIMDDITTMNLFYERECASDTLNLDKALIEASKNNSINALEFLLQRGADIEAYGEEAYNTAMSEDYQDIWMMLMEYGWDQDLKEFVESVEGSKEALENLVNNRVIPGTQDLKDSCLLLAIESCKFKHRQVVQLLLSNGADVHRLNDLALLRALKKGGPQILQMLLKAGADVHAHDNQALMDACDYQDIEMIKMLLDYGADVHARHDSALIQSCQYRQPDIVKLLLERGADLHAQNDEALVQSTMGLGVKTLKYLLKKGARMEVAGDRALQNACGWGRKEASSILLKHGANVHAVEGKSLYDAIDCGRTEIVKYFVKKGASVNSDTHPPLVAAVKTGNVDMVKYLLNHGADINVIEGNPLCKAIEAVNLTMVKLLLERGATVSKSHIEKAASCGKITIQMAVRRARVIKRSP